VGAIAYLIAAPRSPDLAAQLLRTKLFDASGFQLWSNWWYGGHYLLSYSVLFPPLAWAIGPRLVGALAAVGTAWAFDALVRPIFGERAWIGSTWLAAGTVTELMSGRLTFALGLLFATLTALALCRRRPALAVVLAVVTALASPVAAVFAALAGAVALVAVPGRRVGGLAVVIGALAPVVALAVAFPEPGSEPFALSALWPLPLLIGGPLAVTELARFRAKSSHAVTVSAQSRASLTALVLLYLAGCLAAYLIPTPLGGNAARLGELAAGPLVALVLSCALPILPALGRARWLLVGLVPLLLYVQWHAAITDVASADRDPSTTAAYYRPLVRFLSRQPGARRHLWRIEVPFTASHWESYELASEFPLARGWERQLDIGDDGLFYKGRLTARRYESWLHALAVRYVALPDVTLDSSGRAEAALIRAGLSYLRPVFSSRHWRVYEVRAATPLATGVGSATNLSINAVRLSIRKPGRTLLRLRYSPYWTLRGVAGCIKPAGAETAVVARAAGTATVAIRFAPGRVDARTPRCNA
jgi:hypothetical protein